MAITPLNEQDRAWVVEEAKRRAGPNATDAQQKRELYNYAQWQGKTPEELDQWMGYTSGTSAAWNAANPLGGTPAQNNPATIGANMVVSGPGNQTAVNTPMPPAANLGIGGGGAAAPVAATDNRWSGDPTKNPDGTTKTSRGYDSTNSTTGWDVMGPGWNPGGSNLGMGDTPYQRNPYLDAAARDVGSNMFDQWNRNVAPGLRSGAMATGGYGGSRQGVVEANSLNDLGRNYGQSLTSMYGNDYTNYQNRGIQRQGQQQSYDLGLRNNDLGFANLDSNIYQNNFNNQLQSANFGLGVQDYLNKNNQAGITAGTNIQNTGLDYQKYYNDAIKGYGNAGGTRNGTTTT